MLLLLMIVATVCHGRGYSDAQVIAFMIEAGGVYILYGTHTGHQDLVVQ